MLPSLFQEKEHNSKLDSCRQSVVAVIRSILTSDLADNKFMKGGLDKWDKAGGAIAYQEHFAKVSKAS